MPAPIADPARCDVKGCGRLAVTRTDGSEKDTAVKRVGKDDVGSANEPLNRAAIPRLNICDHHKNWPFSNDAKQFSVDPESKYSERK
jgi:hypothetical protein